jgi:hypothetical protein
MRAGDPYANEELDVRRTSQRRQLRNLPAISLLKEAPQGPSRARADAAMIETALRRAADSLGAQHEGLKDYLDLAQRVTMAEEAERFLKDAIASIPGGEFDESLPRLVRPSVDDRKQLDQGPQDSAAVVRQWMMLVLLADQLADDGYADPRVSTTVTR